MNRHVIVFVRRRTPNKLAAGRLCPRVSVSIMRTVAGDRSLRRFLDYLCPVKCTTNERDKSTLETRRRPGPDTLLRERTYALLTIPFATQPCTQPRRRKVLL